MGLADTFKALSDPLRRSILLMLKNGAITAGEIAETLEISPAALSYHLVQLKKADLLMEYKIKNFVFYKLNATLFDEASLSIEEWGNNYSRLGESGCFNTAVSVYIKAAPYLRLCISNR